ncbi:hypothetical protein KY331_06100 [Candidatus Woesearchaeota archaeon]|nr:hypothetical protein [Candidatus Woesearchaeota archaeon]
MESKKEKSKEELEQELKRLKEFYHTELHRKDKLIDELRESHDLLMKASMHSSEKINKLSEALKKSLKEKKVEK